MVAKIRATSLGDLYSGSVYSGNQSSTHSSYNVRVVIQRVDVDASFLCGYLEITNLVEEHPVITTYFEGDIIGKQHHFLTKKWNANDKTDRDHWSLFPSFKRIEVQAYTDDFQYDVDKENYVYMRWKEQFLVPDHHVKYIHGASFAGFYYMCYDKSTNTIAGYYYHHTSELFQKITLVHQPQRQFAHYDFQ